MVGTAVTLRFVAAAEAEDADLSLVGEAYDQPKNSHDLIIVMELPPALHRYGIFGDHAATNAQEHGFVGALIDGAVRDTHALKEMDFPVFARANSPGYIGYKAIAVELGGPVSVGGRTVHHGDVIVADNDGVLVIKPEEADTVVERAVAIQRWEERGRELLRQGKTFDQIDKIVGPRP
jgi:4-hydroxy-4-methyl-2-oxoglutarate aldolase